MPLIASRSVFEQRKDKIGMLIWATNLDVLYGYLTHSRKTSRRSRRQSKGKRTGNRDRNKKTSIKTVSLGLLFE